MIRIKEKKTNQKLIIILTLLLLMCFISLGMPNLVYAGKCGDALGICLADGSPLVLEPWAYAAWAGFCLNGYAWCKLYFE